MTTRNDDWETLCAIYDDGEAFDGNGGDSQSKDERKLKLTSSLLPNGFCGTVFMTLSTSKIAFARLVKSDGSYRYFTLSRPPILKLDLLYLDSNKEGDDDSCGDDGPSNLRLTWHYYPSEWPTLDKETYRSSLAKKCYSILREEGSFSICQFLEHDAISYYYEDRGDADEIEELETSVNTSNSWKTYSDPHYPDFLLVILPPHIDQLYYSSPGILLHPREEATKLKQLAAEEKSKNKATSTGKKKTKKKKEESIPSSTKIESTLDFGKHALLQNWKDLYKTRCPICLEESMLFSDGVVLPFCQHYCCRDCFDMYLKFKVQDIKQHRTNPFLCPVDSCKRELPMGFCKQFLSPEDIETAKEWYKDLKNPPAWSLDRCLCTKTCGAVGSIRRRKGVTSIEAKATTENSKDDSKPNSSFSALDNLVYCESCDKTWCELCLTRVYDDPVCKPVSSKKQLTKKEAAKIVHSVSNHRYHCQPQNILRFCRRYMAASEEIQQKCEAKYPWIASYSQFCNHDGAALQYILENGQRCPNCLSGVERSEGCFHMKCPTCATHFCYECGTELFPPYYGTHHCWEETVEDEEGNNNNFDYNVDEQLAMALQFME